MSELRSVEDLSKTNLLQLMISQLDGVAVADEQGRYVYVNRRWEELTGYSFAQVKGTYVHDLVPNTYIDTALSTGRPIVGTQLVLPNAQGEQLRVFCSYFPLFHEGRIIGCFVYVFLRNMQEVMTLSEQVRDLLGQVSAYQKELASVRGAKYGIQNIIGSSRQIQEVVAQIRLAARSASTVLIHGETGTGKELVAHSIHSLSQRAANHFVKVNCAAIPADLLESEFFGYEGGAFTGAQKGGKKGKFELASGGSIFLDEIHQMPLPLQPKLLRVLQEREIERVGGGRSIPIDCRIIAAANRPLESLVRDDRFREDLFYRLNVICITVPPLRERREDIPLLAEHLIKELNCRLGFSVPGITAEAAARLMDYDWPGNVRELQNTIERAMNSAWCEPITWQHLEPHVRDKTNRPPHTAGGQTGIRQEKRDLERTRIVEALAAEHGVKKRAAQRLGISRTLLYRKLREYGL